ncbi:LptF/LptG family permease [Gaetbulibacter sp. M240]|uniref:LptF/LptG family permease n=1 Tax=Gaetbulibacter sp. M240 TaxID=3126511 RepID=UPI00374EBF76
MKILDRYILTTYLKTFFSVFAILMLIFILQTIWLYIRELSGKDLDLSIIVKFIAYFTPKLIPLVLPLTILLSSIMVFGSFAENYEFAAMKSTGISLQRAMSGLSIFIVILGIVTFFFSNNVIPWAELNFYNLRVNIYKLKPAMLLAEGQFNEVGAYNIKFDEKSGDQGQYLKNVTIHVKGADKRTNTTVIKSKTGELFGKESSSVLKLILKDGNYYHDIIPQKIQNREKRPFAKSTFDTYTMNIDLSQLNNVDMDEKSNTEKSDMLSLKGLGVAMDSIIKKRATEQEGTKQNLYQRAGVSNFKLANELDTSEIDSIQSRKDSLAKQPLLSVFDLNAQIRLVDLASKAMFSNKQTVIAKEKTIIQSKKDLYTHMISYHQKFALGFACIILFFVGAPLGALIRKGGLGLPMVIAILLFLTYHFIGIFATNSAKNGSLNPILASWFSTLVMLPLGVYLTKRATADRGLFEIGNILDPIKKILKIKDKEVFDYKFLLSYTNERLIDVINNFEDHGLEAEARIEALRILEERENTLEALERNGLEIDSAYKTSEIHTRNYNDHAKFAISLFSTGAILLILFFVFRNNKLPSLAEASIQLSIVSFALYVVYYLKSMLNLNQFYSHIKKSGKRPHVTLLILGFSLYMISFLFLKLKIKEDLKQNCLDSLK